jgi:hypothetical protein
MERDDGKVFMTNVEGRWEEAEVKRKISKAYEALKYQAKKLKKATKDVHKRT